MRADAPERPGAPLECVPWAALVIPAAIGLLACGGEGGTTGPPPPPPPPPPRTAHYVGPDGAPGAAGSREDPWDLATALSQPPEVAPGDTIWIGGGVYSGTFTSTLGGEAGRRILVKARPDERAIIRRDGEGIEATLRIEGPHVWLWDLEIDGAERGCNAIGVNLGLSDADVPGIKLINLYIHDTTGNGIGDWSQAVEAEVYGNVIDRTGLDSCKDNNPFAHGIYAQSAIGSKPIEDNIILRSGSFSLHGFASEGHLLKSIRYIGNITALAGQAEILIAGGEDFEARENVVFGRIPLRVGFTPSGLSAPLVQGNYLVNAANANAPAFMPQGLGDLVFRDNTLVTLYSGDVRLIQQLNGFSATEWSGNTYYGDTSAREFQWLRPDVNRTMTWEQFRDQFPDLTATDVYAGRLPQLDTAIVRPNRYEDGRANVAAFDWDGDGSVSVDLSSAVGAGQAWEIRDAFDFGGPAVATGAGPMATVPVRSDGFGAFVVLPR